MTTEYVPIPLTVIGGFLGAGKTTYLNHLIQGGLPPNTLIIVNDFGDINIDADLIDYYDDNIMQLSNGCVCCTLGGTLAEQLAAALRVRSSPGAIVIEASGVANPARIADIARLSRRMRLAEVVCVVNGSQALRHATDSLIGDAWHTQVAAADVLHINRLTTSNEEDALELLKRVNSTAALKLDMIHETEHQSPVSKQNNKVYLSTSQRNTDILDPMSHDTWRSFALTGKTSVDAEELVTLIKAYADVLFRAKGFVFFDGKKGARLLQFSGGNVRWQPALRAPDENRLVFIGVAGERFEAFKKIVEGLLT